eukprot:1389680-Amphidinium_carterae.1
MLPRVAFAVGTHQTATILHALPLAADSAQACPSCCSSLQNYVQFGTRVSNISNSGHRGRKLRGQ